MVSLTTLRIKTRHNQLTGTPGIDNIQLIKQTGQARVCMCSGAKIPAAHRAVSPIPRLRGTLTGNLLLAPMKELRILSHSDEPFSNRLEAGRLLGHELEEWHEQRTVVLGIPRGGLIVARELARALDADLDIVLSRKLRAPGNPELAIGAIAEDGKLFLDEMLLREMSVESTYIQQEKERQLVEIAQRTELSRRILPKVPLKGRPVIVTDDGVATGATMQAALWAARQEHPSKLIAALPVGPEETVRRLAKDADEMICLRAPPFFNAVGQFYIRFEQIEDEEMLAILKEEHQRKGGKWM